VSYTRLSTTSRLYVVLISALGCAVLLYSVFDLYVNPVGYQWFVLAALTLLSGSITIRVPSVPATISVSETFVFTATLLFGPSAGTLIVALDGLVISLWLHRKSQAIYRTVFNTAAPAISIWTGAQLFYFISGARPLAIESTPILDLLPALAVLTIVYFMLNSWLMAIAVSCESPLTAPLIWRENFMWVSLSFFGGSSVAALLVSLNRQVTLGALTLIVPLLVISYLTFKSAMGRVEDANHHLEQLNRLYLSTIETLAMAIDAKDQITHGHIRRVQQYAIALARALGMRDEHQIRAIEAAALLHDMGKLAVPEYILNKPGRLTRAEFDKMKLHASVGADILSAIDFPYPVVPIVRHHHENWNGLGYPDGLRGTDIPMGARILAVVDCFDALTSDRPYRARLSVGEALAILSERRGSMYDPLVVDKFMAVYHELALDESDSLASKQAVFEITRASLGSLEAASASLPVQSAAVDSNSLLALYDMAQSLTINTTFCDAADMIAKHLRRVVPFELCVFFVYDKQQDCLIVAHAVGHGAPALTSARISLGERLSGWVAANKQTIVNSDPMLDLLEIYPTMSSALRAALVTPLTEDKNLVGVLALYADVANVFNEDHRRIIEVLAKQIAGFVYQSSAHESSRRALLTDAGTGLPNTEYLKRLFSSSGQFGGESFYPLTLLLLDIRKATGGAGCVQSVDERLAGNAATAIRRSLRGADILFRYGNNEFIVILTRTESSLADQIARRMVEATSCLPVTIASEEHAQIVVRVGGATAPGDGRALVDLVATARQRLELWTMADGPMPGWNVSVH
jgi:diguanylate cyclase (GGDEF)-like protein/putative nucleotidyltransferase with HDIG domain